MLNAPIENGNANSSKDKSLEPGSQKHIDSISFSSVFNEAINPHLLFSLDGQILDLNKAGSLYLGIDGDQWGQISIFDLLIPSDEKIVRQILADILDVRVGVLEVHVKSADVGILTCDMFYQVVESAHVGTVVYARLHDLQIVRYLSRQLEEKERGFRGAQRLANLGSWELHPKEGRITWSDEVFNIFGLPITPQAPSFEEYVNKVHPEDVQHFTEIVQNAINKGEDYLVKHRIRRPDGSIRWIYGRGDVLLDEYGNLEKLYGTVQDITKEEVNRDSMRKSEQRIRFHLDRSPLGYIEWNLGFEVVEWNEAAEGIFGFSKEEALAGEVNIIPDEEAEQINQVVTNLLSDIGGTHSINSNLTKSGRRIICEWFNTTLKGENGDIIGIGSIVKDITQQIESKKQLEDYASELEVARDQAESAARAKSNFLANMSHEIRTPMNGVIGMASILLDTELDEEQKDYVETIVSSGESLLSIINDILDFSKIDAGKVELESLPYNIREVIENTFDLIAAKAAEKEIELIYVIDPAVPHELIGDPLRVQQILLNLMSNAIKFTESGYIEVYLESNLFEQSHSVLTFHVKDTGIGIAEEKLDRLFAAFSQVDVSISRKYGGTGLGLSISSQLAKLMGGDISVSSKEGVGSVFSFSIRVKNGRKIVYEKEDLRGMRVLLAESNLKMQQMIGSFLDELNCNWVSVTNKEDLFACLTDSSDFDVMLIEKYLESESGIEIAQIVNEMGENMPDIILMSWIIDRTNYEGIQNRLAKPIHFKNLYRLLNKVELLQK